MSLTYASICDGIGAVHCAWAALGWRCAWVSEIEPFACAVVDHHWLLPNLGDMTKITEDQLHGCDQRLELIVGGTPCQSFSVAGLRKGLADPRGNLALVFLRLIDAARPRWILWENVPGVLSVDSGRAFGAFLGALAQFGYGFTWRILDAQFFGVPQRRRRIFVVGYLGDWRPAAAVLLEPEGLCRNPAPRRKTRSQVARALTGSTGGCSAKEQQTTFIGADGRPLNALCMSNSQSNSEILDDLCPTLTCMHEQPVVLPGQLEVVGPICAHSKEHGHAMTTQQAAYAGHLIAHALTAEHDASEDGTGRGVPLVPHAFDCKQDGRGDADVAPTLRAMGNDGGNANAGGQLAVAYPLDLRNASRDADKLDEVNRQGLGVGESGDPSPTCSTAFVPGVAYAFEPRIGRCDRGQPAQVVPALAGSNAGATSDSRPCIATSYAVRRLTPRECERLQGFPDDYTLITFRGKPAADGPRYRALGNSMAVPVMAWIGQRIQIVDDLLQERTPVILETGAEGEVK